MKDEKQLIRDLFLPSRTGSRSLSTAMAARTGSGKTELLSHLIREARKDEAFKETRFVYVSIKQEQRFGEKSPIVDNIPDLLKAMSKEPIVSYYPRDPEFYEVDLDDIIETMFQVADDVEGGIVLVVDDANVIKGFDSRGQPSPAVKKLTIAGRSKGIRGMFITHRLANLPRLMNEKFNKGEFKKKNKETNKETRTIIMIVYVGTNLRINTKEPTINTLVRYWFDVKDTFKLFVKSIHSCS